MITPPVASRGHGASSGDDGILDQNKTNRTQCIGEDTQVYEMTKLLYAFYGVPVVLRIMNHAHHGILPSYAVWDGRTTPQRVG